MSLILPWRFAWRPMAETSDYAYAMQMRMCLAKVREAEVFEGEMTESQAIHIAARLMRDNQLACFDVEGTRAAIKEDASV